VQRHYVAGVEIPGERIRVYTITNGGAIEAGITQVAETGEAAENLVVIDDPDGDYDIAAWQQYVIEEDDCSEARMFTGYVLERQVASGSYADGVGRVWRVTVLDLNGVLAMPLIDGDDAKRPYEFEDDRIGWLLSTYLAGYKGAPAVYDNGLVSLSSTVGEDEADYTDQFPIDVLTAIAPFSGSNFFLYWDSAATPGEEISFYYQAQANPVLTSTLAVSNVLDDIDLGTPFESRTTFSPTKEVEAAATYDPREVWGTVALEWRGGRIVRSLQSTIDTFIGRGYRFVTDRIGRASTADAIIDQILQQHSVEKGRLRFGVELPSTAVNLLQAGQRVSVRFSNLPGYETATYVRVVRRTVRSLPDPERYRVEIEATNDIALPAPGGGNPGELPHQCQSPTIVNSQQCTFGDANGLVMEWNFTPQENNVLAVFITNRAGPTAPFVPEAGWTVQAEAAFTTIGGVDYDSMGIITKTSDGTETSLTLAQTGSTSTHRAFIVEFDADEATFAVGAFTEGAEFDTTMETAPVTAPSGDAIVGGFFIGQHNQDDNDIVPGAGWTQLWRVDHTGHPQALIEYHIYTPASGTYTPDGTITGLNAWRSVAFAIGGETCQPPATGQWVYNESPTPSTDVAAGDTITTDWPFADGSLLVYLDNMPQPGTIASYDGAAGTFTLTFTVLPSEQLTVSYQGR
jgi:hypothetical protein